MDHEGKSLAGAPKAPEAAAEAVRDACGRIQEQLARRIVGQGEVIEQLLIALLARGHCLLEGVPGLAKTLLVSSLAETLSLSFNRIQFTPDLMPSDITGTEILQEDRGTGTRELRFYRGPVFANVVLADEINRTPPKTQAALLEAMQERQVTAAGTKHELAEPFYVLATQNPIEQAGTYPLPEAQLDRFLFKVLVDYPEEAEEFDVVRLGAHVRPAPLEPVLSGQEILRLQEDVRAVPVADSVVRYALALARATRVGKAEVPDFVRQWVEWGVGPRASQYLITAARARALMKGRLHVTYEDVRALVPSVFRHRLVMSFAGEAEGVAPDALIARLLDTIRPGPGADGAGDAVPPALA
jgi:MoxR-like ATPase